MIRNIWGPDDKSVMPKEKFLREGPESISDPELLTTFLGTGLPVLSVLQLATRLLVQIDGIRGLNQVYRDEFLRQHGIGVAKCEQLTAALGIAKR